MKIIFIVIGVLIALICAFILIFPLFNKKKGYKEAIIKSNNFKPNEFRKFLEFLENNGIEKILYKKSGRLYGLSSTFLTTEIKDIIIYFSTYYTTITILEIKKHKKRKNRKVFLQNGSFLFFLYIEMIRQVCFSA